jgi:hypothetical protein
MASRRRIVIVVLDVGVAAILALKEHKVLQEQEAPRGNVE